MKTALISDIHANLEALTAVLNDIDGNQIDQIICLGDVIGYGSDPVGCLELVQKHCKIKLIGNHEYAALGLTETTQYNSAAQQATEWTKTQLGDFELSILDDFIMEHSADNIHYVHASPFEPDRWRYILAPNSALEGFMHFDEKICFFGHTHVPQIFSENENGLPRCQVGHDFLPDPDGRYLINVGSVGQPRDNDPRACYVIFDDKEYEVISQRVEYNIAETQRKMTAAQMPHMLISRLSAGR